MHNCLGDHDIFNSVGFFGIVKNGQEFASSDTGFRYIKVNEEAEPFGHYEVEIFEPKTLVYLNQPQPQYDPHPRLVAPIYHVARATDKPNEPELSPAEMREMLDLFIKNAKSLLFKS